MLFNVCPSILILSVVLMSCRVPESASDQKSLDNTMVKKESLNLNTCGLTAASESATIFAKEVSSLQSDSIQDAVALAVSGFSANELRAFTLMVNPEFDKKTLGLSEDTNVSADLKPTLRIHFDLDGCSKASGGVATQENGVLADHPIFCVTYDEKTKVTGLHFSAGKYKDEDLKVQDMTLEQSIRHGLVRGLSYVQAAYTAAALKGKDDHYKKVQDLAQKMGFAGSAGVVQAIAEILDSAVCSVKTRDDLETNKSKGYDEAREILAFLKSENYRVAE